MTFEGVPALRSKISRLEQENEKLNNIIKNLENKNRALNKLCNIGESRETEGAYEIKELQEENQKLKQVIEAKDKLIHDWIERHDKLKHENDELREQRDETMELCMKCDEQADEYKALLEKALKQQDKESE